MTLSIARNRERVLTFVIDYQRSQLKSVSKGERLSEGEMERWSEREWEWEWEWEWEHCECFELEFLSAICVLMDTWRAEKKLSSKDSFSINNYNGLNFALNQTESKGLNFYVQKPSSMNSISGPTWTLCPPQLLAK